MKYTIYMLKAEATAEKRFMRYDWTVNKYGAINPEEYDHVYTGEIEPAATAGEMLERIYTMLNIDHPADYTERSLSVSDLVELDGIGTYFCDSFGFRKLDNQLTIFDL